MAILNTYYLSDAPPLPRDGGAHSQRISWVDKWLQRNVLYRVNYLLGRAYEAGVGGSEADYTWPARGWSSDRHFQMHCALTLRENNTCVVARRQSYTEAQLLIARLERFGLRTALSSSDPTALIAFGLHPYPSEHLGDEVWSRSQRTGEFSRIAEELGLPDEVLQSLDEADISSLGDRYHTASLLGCGARLTKSQQDREWRDLLIFSTSSPKAEAR